MPPRSIANASKPKDVHRRKKPGIPYESRTNHLHGFLSGLLGVDPEMKADDFRNALYGGMRMAAQPSWLERCVRFYNLVWHKKEHVVKPIVVVFDSRIYACGNFYYGRLSSSTDGLG